MRRNLKLAAFVAALVCLSQLANASVPQAAPSWDFTNPTPRIVTTAPSWDFTLTTAEVCVLPTAATEWNFAVDTESVNADKVSRKTCTEDCPCPRKDCGEDCPCCGKSSEPDLTDAAAYERAKTEHRRAIVVVGQTAKVKAEQRAIAKANGWLFAAEDVVSTVNGSLPSGVHQFSPPASVPIEPARTIVRSFETPSGLVRTVEVPVYSFGGGGCANGQCGRR